MSSQPVASSPDDPIPGTFDSRVLRSGLLSVLGGAGCRVDTLEILGREQHVYVSSYPSEVVTVRIADGVTLRLLCKYSATAARHTAFGHRGGIAREAEVYASVLCGQPLSVPRYYGSCEDPTTGATCLVLEYLHGCHRMSKFPDGPQKAAEWLGHFHSLNSRRVADYSLAFLPRYDLAYYGGWISRTIEYASLVKEQFNWIGKLEEHAVEICTVLQAAPITVIHGEYYSENVLMCEDTIIPVDWESAALAPGEIDLASLTEGWDAADKKNSELVYCEARWPDSTPADFHRTLAAARIYFLARWLGEEPQWTTRRGHLETGEDLRRQLEQWK